jgi:hypothetical protein
MMQLLTGAEKDVNVTFWYCYVTSKCLNRTSVAYDKPLKAKLFFVLNPSRVVQLNLKTPKFCGSM